MGIHKQFRKARYARLSLACLTISVWSVTSSAAQTRMNYKVISPYEMEVEIYVSSAVGGTSPVLASIGAFGFAGIVRFGNGYDGSATAGSWDQLFFSSPLASITGAYEVTSGNLTEVGSSTSPEWGVLITPSTTANLNDKGVDLFGCLKVTWAGSVDGLFAESGTFTFTPTGVGIGTVVTAGTGCFKGLPGGVMFDPPRLVKVVGSYGQRVVGGSSLGMAGPSGDIRVGNSGFVPAGGGLVGVGYDRGDNDSRDQFSGHADRIHLDYVQRFGQFFAGIAGEYRQSKYTLDNSDPWETKYYGPRIDLGWIWEQGGSGKDAINPDYAYVQLSGGYLWGKGKLDGVTGDRGYLIPSSLVVGASKQFKPRLALQPEANLQWMWQKLGTIGAATFENRNYGRADFNLGLEALLKRGWFITPNAGYRWDIKAVCTNRVLGGAETCVPKANGLRYGVQVGKESTAGRSFINQLALSAYYDYFNKSGVKQTQWGVMAQYPF